MAKNPKPKSVEEAPVEKTEFIIKGLKESGDSVVVVPPPVVEKRKIWSDPPGAWVDAD